MKAAETNQAGKRWVINIFAQKFHIFRCMNTEAVLTHLFLLQVIKIRPSNTAIKKKNALNSSEDRPQVQSQQTSHPICD